MGKLKDTLDKAIEKLEAELPTPAEVSAKFEAEAKEVKAKEEAEAKKAESISPTVKMAIEQAEFNRIRDLYHGFK